MAGHAADVPQAERNGLWRLLPVQPVSNKEIRDRISSRQAEGPEMTRAPQTADLRCPVSFLWRWWP